uniref:T6SS Phospholipase effector Tle1-like catalytic domain-containing protein n=1 Tax=Rhodopseudomonas palustris (strain BisA53) TaxID=316055 RepID=Q07H09_RHOP5
MEEAVKKRIVLLSDGTGNSASKVWKSNVWRLFESLDLRGEEQIAFYDDGVGTSSFKPLAILGGVFGWGLKRNVLDIYKFLCTNYRPGDKIYGFGFSRGAFTIRVVIGLILSQGLVRGDTDAEFYQNAKMAYRAYRAEKFRTIWRIEMLFRLIRDAVLYLFGVRYDKANNQVVDQIAFVGVWDTVAAYGMPIDEMARGISQWIWPLELPNRVFDLRIQRACHALSLDDERTTFHPVLWNEDGVPAEQLSQVWFAGVHSNVGGGYPDDSLAYIPLVWIMKEAQAFGLQFKTIPNTPNDPDPDMMAYAEWRRDKDGRLYDSRNGLGGYYRYGPRRIQDLSHMRFSLRTGDRVNNNRLPRIHASAIIRAQRGAHRYAPIGIPHYYDVLGDNGVEPQVNYEPKPEADARARAQERIWNYVWRRRIIYFVTVFASLYIAIYPLSRAIPSSGEFSTSLSLVSGAIRAVGHVLPGALSSWVDAYARDPSHFLALGALVVLLVTLGGWLGRKIRDRMERIWREARPTALSKAEQAWLGVGTAAAVYVLALTWLSRWLTPWLPGWLLPPPSVQHYLSTHVSGSVSLILVFTMIALLTPETVVQHLRSWRVYRLSIRTLKLYVLPFFFAFGFLALAVLFGNHLVFSIEQANGHVCSPTDALAKSTNVAKNYGIDRCVLGGLATCPAGSATPTCSIGREVYCSEGQPSCEPRVKVGCTKGDCNYDMPICRVPIPAGPGTPASSRSAGPATCPEKCEVQPRGESKLFKIDEVCHATNIWLEEGQRYLIRLSPAKETDAVDSRTKQWTDNGRPVSTRGPSPAGVTLWQRGVALVKWPLKRHLFVDPIKVIARVGSDGSDEFVLEPDPGSDRLDVEIKPRRSGELFLYVNEAVLPFRGGRDWFYRDNSGEATLAVQRPRQPN